jgi:hypothetical protein
LRIASGDRTGMNLDKEWSWTFADPHSQFRE